MAKIAIIEDDKGLNNGIALALKREDYEFYSYYTLKEAGDVSQMDLVILDINLPDGNGLDFLKALRQRSQVPVLVLTAKDSEMDEVAGLELGAQDYMTKPFSLAVLRVRTEKILREKLMQAEYACGGLRFNFTRMEFWRGEEKIDLSRTEQRLLHILVENEGHAVTREQLLEYVWQQSDFIDENALSVTVKRLRDKLEKKEERYIKTVYGIGYKWSRAHEE